MRKFLVLLFAFTLFHSAESFAVGERVTWDQSHGSGSSSAAPEKTAGR